MAASGGLWSLFCEAVPEFSVAHVPLAVSVVLDLARLLGSLFCEAFPVDALLVYC